MPRLCAPPKPFQSASLEDGVAELFTGLEFFAQTGRVPMGIATAAGLSVTPPAKAKQPKRFARSPSFYRWWHRFCGKSPQARAFMEASDRALVGYLHAAGCFQVVPALKDTDSCVQNTSCFTGTWGLAGEVVINSRLDGSCPLGKVHGAPMSRWLTLLHEVAHQEFMLLSSPFQPSSRYELSASMVRTLNAWTTGSLLKGSALFNLLEEAFADTYAAMLMWRLVPAHVRPLAEAQIRAVQSCRQSEQAMQEKAMFKQWLQSESNEMPGLLDDHLTAFALQQLWQYPQSWQTAPLEDLKQVSLQMASDGLMDLMQPTRVTPRLIPGGGFPVGALYRFMCLPDSMSKVLTDALYELALSHLHGANPHVISRDVPEGCPDLKAAVDALWPACRASISARFPEARGVALASGNSEVPWIILKAAVRDFLDRLPKNDPTILTFQAALHQAGQAIFEEMVDGPLREAGQFERFPALARKRSAWQAALL